ncbi:hypothetical protein SASPL_101140 [Salvia splendens]|uniref:Cell wall hydroxyproline-rich glycoprotein n=1 Tax=Salvia splendens TaxID=180675 RepID=A0A8X8YRD5_SALSN|nr:hypothetical protein SASPL_101140 [Salvia splendens]
MEIKTLGCCLLLIFSQLAIPSFSQLSFQTGLGVGAHSQTGSEETTNPDLESTPTPEPHTTTIPQGKDTENENESTLTPELNNNEEPDVEPTQHTQEKESHIENENEKEPTLTPELNNNEEPDVEPTQHTKEKESHIENEKEPTLTPEPNNNEEPVNHGEPGIETTPIPKEKESTPTPKANNHKESEMCSYKCASEPTPKLANQRLEGAYKALRALKKSIYSDPNGFTSNWEGPDVCSYKGVFCAKAMDDANIVVVAGVDLNRGDIAGHLPSEIGYLVDISLLHLNSNRFCGIIPNEIKNLKLLYELDVSNNRFVGSFPEVVLELPQLKYLDLRYNDFEGELPPGLFDKPLDAIFLNNNRFHSTIPENIGNSPASVIVMSNNHLYGCIPSSIGKMAGKLEEFVVSYNELSGCLPEEITMLNTTKVFDISNNKFMGDLPQGMENMKSIEVLNIGNNKFRSKVSKTVCTLTNLKNFTYSYNFFDAHDPECMINALPVMAIDGRKNCLPREPNQRPEKECRIALSKKVDCNAGCRPPTYGHSPKLDQPKKESPKTPTPHKPTTSFPRHHLLLKWRHQPPPPHRNLLSRLYDKNVLPHASLLRHLQSTLRRPKLNPHLLQLNHSHHQCTLHHLL